MKPLPQQQLAQLIATLKAQLPPPLPGAEDAMSPQAPLTLKTPQHSLLTRLNQLSQQLAELTLQPSLDEPLKQFKLTRISEQLEALARTIFLSKQSTQKQFRTKPAKSNVYQPDLRFPEQELAKLRSFQSTLEQKLGALIDASAAAHHIRAQRERVWRCQEAIAVVQAHLNRESE